MLVLLEDGRFDHIVNRMRWQNGEQFILNGAGECWYWRTLKPYGRILMAYTNSYTFYQPSYNPIIPISKVFNPERFEELPWLS